MSKNCGKVKLMRNERIALGMNKRKEILQETKKMKVQSKSYQEYYMRKKERRIDEIGGHVSYLDRETEKSMCPSDQFVGELLKRCAQELGINYEY